MRAPAELLHEAMRGDATAAAELWQAIAEGRADDATTLAWAREVAVQVVAKVLPSDLPANRRAEKARMALGLEGRIDTNRALADWVEASGAGATAGELAEIADLVVDVGKAKPHQLKRKIEHIRQKRKKQPKE